MNLTRKDNVSDKRATEQIAKRRFLRNFGDFLRNSVTSPKFWRTQYHLQQLILTAFVFNHRIRLVSDIGS
jgi:hypothetical protein